MVFQLLFWSIIIFLLSGIKIVYQYERGVKFTLGKYSGIMHPGLRFVIPILQTWQKIDIRVNVVDVPEQDCITQDNVSVKVNAVLYFKVLKSELAIIKVEHYYYAVTQLAQTTMRNVVGQVTLDQLLSSKEEISNRIEAQVDKATDPWGIKVSSVDLKDVILPEQLKRTMAKAAETERERRALIIQADGEKVASANMMKAAKILGGTSGALHLRTLQNLNDMSSDQTNTIVFAIPVEALGALQKTGLR